MKQSLLRLSLLSLLFFLGRQEVFACHGVALVGFSATTNANSVTVNGSSDAATCGCGPYYMEVEIVCFSAGNFTGNAPGCNAANWNVFPWYRSLLNIPNYTAPNWVDNCLVEPYGPVTISFNDLCPGTQYVLRARERVCGSGSGGPWSANFTFTTPGTPPNFTLTATANPNIICPGNPVTLNAVLTGSGGCGTGNPIFTWTPGNLIGQTVIVNPSVTTVYTVTVTGGYVSCYPVPPATVTVTVLPPPISGVASVSPPVVCQGSCVTLTLTGYTGSIQWQSSPNGITWTNINGATTSPYVFCPVMAAMFFHAVVSGAPGCGTVTSNTVSVGITPVPTLTINPAAPSICAGQSVTLTVSGSSGYTWSGPNSYSATGASITISPTVTGTYSVATSGPCPASQTVTVTVNPAPVIVFSPPAPAICSGSSVTIDAGSNANTYNWVPITGITSLSASNDSVSAAPLTTTTYNVTSTTSAGCTANANITVTVNPIPALVLSDDSITICPNMTDTITVSGANTYTWNTMSGVSLLTPNGSMAEFNPVASATYTVTGTTTAGCADSAVVVVTVANNLVVDAGLPDSICPGTSTVLTATGGNYYTWSANNPTAIVNGNTANPTVSPTVSPTVFTVNVSSLAGCTGVDSVTIFLRNLPTANAGVDTSICLNGAVNLSGNGSGTYSWAGSNITSGASTATPTVSPTATGNYVLTITDIYGCTNSDSVNVVVHPLPNASAGPDQFICGTSCANLLASGGSVYQWTPPATLSSPNTAATQACPPTSSTYTVQVTDIYGCVNSDSVKVIVYSPLTVVASPDDSICPGAIGTVSATAAAGDGGPYIYSWAPSTGLANPNAQSTNATPTVTTTYTITVSDVCGSTPVTDSVTIVVFQLPVISTSPSITAGCAPVCVDFTGASAPAAVSCGYDFGDQTTSTNCNPTHCFTTPGNYTVIYTATDLNGCTSTITYPNMITVYPNPTPGFIPSPQTTSIINPLVTFTPNCTNCDTTLYSIPSYACADSIFGGPVMPYNVVFCDTGSFWVYQMVSNQYGCVAYDSMLVVVEPDWSFYAPNAFTPNDDLHNDVFMVTGEGIDPATFEMFVFDRWGNTIFVSKDLYLGWNGHANGGAKVAQMDTYVWSVKFKDLKGDQHKFVGHVTIVQ